MSLHASRRSSDTDQPLKVIALNVADPDSYIALWNTGQLAFNTGKDDTFDEPDLKHFMLKNTSEAEWNW